MVKGHFLYLLYICIKDNPYSWIILPQEILTARLIMYYYGKQESYYIYYDVFQVYFKHELQVARLQNLYYRKIVKVLILYNK
jgi:hypothetical protein